MSSRLWCPQCLEWKDYDPPTLNFFALRCEECGAELEEEEPYTRTEVDYKDMEIDGDVVKVGGVEWFTREEENDEEDEKDEDEDEESDESEDSDDSESEGEE